MANTPVPTTIRPAVVTVNAGDLRRAIAVAVAATLYRFAGADPDTDPGQYLPVCIDGQKMDAMIWNVTIDQWGDVPHILIAVPATATQQCYLLATSETSLLDCEALDVRQCVVEADRSREAAFAVYAAFDGAGAVDTTTSS